VFGPAQSAQLGSAWLRGQLGLQLSRPARSSGRPAHLTGRPTTHSSLSLIGRSHVSVLVGFGTTVFGSGVIVQGCVCVCVGIVGVCAQAHARCSAKSPKGLAATRTRRCSRVAGSPRTARPWRGHGEAGVWPGHVVWVGTHARGSWLPRGVAWPCRARGTGIPGP
jgi:hypothetical protein